MTTHHNALRFAGQPATIPGLSPCCYCYGHDIRSGTSILGAGNAARAVQYVAANRPAPGVPIFLDIEYAEGARGEIVYDFRQDIRKPRRGETAKECCDAVRAHMDALADVVLAVKTECPENPVIPYAGLMIEDQYTARCGDYSHIERYARQYDEWLIAQSFIWNTRLRRVVDGVYCPMFLISEIHWSSGEWERSAVRIFEQAEGYGLPVYVQLSPFIKNKWVFVQPDTYAGMVRLCEDFCVNAVHWASGGHRVPPMTWDEFARAGTMRTVVETVPVGGGVQ